MITELMEQELLIKGLKIENSTLRELLKDKEYEIHKLRKENLQICLDTLEKRVADLEQGKKLFLLDDNSTPIKSFTLTGKLTVMDKTTEEKLEVGKWYDARTFEVETLKKLLPVGTLVEITESLTADESVKESPKVRLEKSRVTKVVAENNILGVADTVIYVESFMHVSCNWFKIVEEEY